MSEQGGEAMRDVVAHGTRASRLGRVERFDPDRGLGEVLGEAGGRFAFHCTAISDGTRLVAPGTRVSFTVAPAPGGVFEAVAVSPL